MSVFDQELGTGDHRVRSHVSPRWQSSVQRVLVHMHGHLDEKQSSESLADIAALSRFHFNRVFRNVTGLPPAFFLAALRLETAKRLLLTTDMSVTNICLDVGYGSLGTFVSRFTELVGMSPRALRRIATRMEGTDLRRLPPPESPVEVTSRKISPALAGQIVAPPGFEGVICVGLYDALLPHARPLQCAALTGSGMVEFDHLPLGQYIMAAGALRPRVEMSSFLNAGVFLRAMSGPVSVNGFTVQLPDLVLRSSEAFDPPILAPLPAMWAQRAGVNSIRSHSRSIDMPPVVD
jgi:AraC family transcriptional regulator